MNNDSEDEIRRLIKAVCKSASASPEFKEELLKRLTHTVDDAAKGTPRLLWRQPKLWVPIVASIILAVIGYGIWLSLTLELP